MTCLVRQEGIRIQNALTANVASLKIRLFDARALAVVVMSCGLMLMCD